MLLLRASVVRSFPLFRRWSSCDVRWFASGISGLFVWINTRRDSTCIHDFHEYITLRVLQFSDRMILMLVLVSFVYKLTLEASRRVALLVSHNIYSYCILNIYQFLFLESSVLTLTVGLHWGTRLNFRFNNLPRWRPLIYIRLNIWQMRPNVCQYYKC